MPDPDDHHLLAEFARRESADAFAALVARYVNLVHSIALRSTGNLHDAQEITQAVFIILARKAGSLRRDTIISGWLYQTARLTAANFMKAQTRRQHREQEAYLQSTLNEPSDTAWQQIAPLLDDAMGRLGETDRNTIVLRFFQNRTAAETACALNLTEAAAHKRTHRAVEKLRKFFARRGVVLTAAIIAAASTRAVQAAPPGTAASVSLMAVKGTTISATLTTLAQTTMKTMSLLKLKFVLVTGLTALLIGAVATVALSGGAPDAPAPVPAAPSTPATQDVTLQFHLVVDGPSADTQSFTNVIRDDRVQRTLKEIVYVQKEILLDQTAIQSARVSTDQLNQPQIEFSLTPKGAQQFAKITRENLHRRLAIIIDDKLISAPTIQSEISGGNGVISGNFTKAEATDIATHLNRAAKK